MVSCRYEGCGKSVLFANLKSHEANECDYKPIRCKFHLLGCLWKGVRRDLPKHESKCGKTIDANDSLPIVQRLHESLVAYKRFCRECHSICSETVHVQNRGEFEVTAAEELMLCGYDFTVAVRSTKKSGNRRTQDVYELAVKVAFDEDPSVFSSSETEQINIGVIVDPNGDGKGHFMMEMKCQISRDQLDSGWKAFEQTMSNEEYNEAFRGGFCLKVFDFADV